jgi:F-type H+-transporting ATPase subunit b
VTFNLWTFLFEVLNFLVLAYILHRLLYRPLRAAIEKRQAENDKARAEVEAAEKEAEAAREQLSAKLAAVDSDRQELLRKVASEAEAEKSRRLDEAAAAAEAVREEARRDAGQLRRDTLAGLEREVGEMAVGFAERLLTQACDASLNDQLTRRLVETVRSVAGEEREQVRRDVSLDGVVIESATPLDGEILKDLAAALRDVVGQPCEVKVEVKPALVAGALARAGGHVWDATVAAQLAAARAAITESGNGKAS